MYQKSKWSLKAHLLTYGFVFSLLLLLGAGFGLVKLFENYTYRTNEQEGRLVIEQIIGNLVFEDTIKLKKTPNDPLFEKPLSGLYWQVSNDDTIIFRSRSLWDNEIKPLKIDTQTSIYLFDKKHLLLERKVFIEEKSYYVSFANENARILETIRDYTHDLFKGLALIFILLLLAFYLQVKFGLLPLSQLKEEIDSLEKKEEKQINKSYFSEITPLIESLNLLLLHQTNEIKRSNLRASDLAHGLKTSLTAIDAIARESHNIELAEINTMMKKNINRELVRARMIGKIAFQETFLKPLIDNLIKVLSRSPRGEDILFENQIEDNFTFKMAESDAQELFGNLLENALRYANSKVVIFHSMNEIFVEDDGDEVSNEVLQILNNRLLPADQRSNTGLGIAIARDIVENYGFHLHFEPSQNGGLKVRLILLNALSFH